MEKCNCYHEDYGKSECWGTKERDVCSCGGDETKCNVYPKLMTTAQVIESMKHSKEKNTFMTITEYRKKNPDCKYCKHRIPPFSICLATNKKMSKKQAKKNVLATKLRNGI